jgi:hypothetical protein
MKTGRVANISFFHGKATTSWGRMRWNGAPKMGIVGLCSCIVNIAFTTLARGHLLGYESQQLTS